MIGRGQPPNQRAPGERLVTAVIIVAGVAAAVAAVDRHGELRQISDMIAGLSILTGFLFAHLLFIFQLRMRITDSQTIPTYGSLRRLVNGAFRRSEYAVVSALATTIVAVCANAFSKVTRHGVDEFPGRYWTAALLYLSIQTVGLLLASIWDVHRAYRQMPG